MASTDIPQSQPSPSEVHDKASHHTESKESDADNGQIPSVEEVAREKDLRNDQETDAPSVKEEPQAPAARPGPPPPVDHGLKCWVQVVGSFALWTNSWGLVNAYGQFQTYYETILLPHNSASQISWVGSIQAFLLLFGGTLSGPLYDAGYFKHICIVGNVMVVLGLMFTSICNSYWQVVLAQGLFTGFGFGLLFLPCIAIVPQYFVKRRSFASGVAATGSGFGGVMYPIVLRRLQRSIGFGWAVRVMGFIALFFGLVSIVTLRNKIPASKVRSLIDPTFFSNRPMLLLGVGAFFTFIGMYVPMVYIGVYSLEKDITGPTLAFYLLPILQAASIFGRIIPNFFADKTGPVNMIVPTTFVVGILALCWIAIKDEAGIIVFVILYGASSGLILSLLPSVIPALVLDMKTFGTNLGMVMCMASLGVLVGTPISGAILRHSGHFYGLQAFGGVCLLVGGIFYAAARVAKVGTGIAKI